MRCEGWIRHGGAFTFGPVVWAQCKSDGVVMLRFIDNQNDGGGKECLLPACIDCWKKCIENNLNILDVTPLGAEIDNIQSKFEDAVEALKQIASPTYCGRHPMELAQIALLKIGR